jgi:hypothetical protein
VSRDLDWDEVNIFFTHLNPTIAAEFACDAHVRKMVVESTQMLANAYHMDKATAAPPPKADGMPYKQSHWNHPCAVWARADFKHWDWLRMHAYGLAKEFKHRFGKEHECLKALGYMTENLPLAWMQHNHFTCPPLAMPEKYHSRVASPIGCYRNYIRDEKRHLHTWTNREPPLWLIKDDDKLRAMADKLVEMCRLACFDADDYRAELATDVSDDTWNAAVEVANLIANGEDDDEGGMTELAQDIFDRCRLQLLGADAHRASFPGLSEAEWKLVKHVATERANGNDPLAMPANWDFTHYRG